MSSANDFRRIALGLTGVIESAHMNHPDFRVAGKIFATLHHDDQFGMVKLPPDEQAHGFSNNAEALSMHPALIDRYLTAAAKIARLAVGDPTIPAGFERYAALEDNSNEHTWLLQNERLGEDFPLGSRGGIVARHYFPVDGEYIFKIRLDRTDTGLIRGLYARNDIEVRVDGVRTSATSARAAS